MPAMPTLLKCFLGSLILHLLCYFIWGFYAAEFSDRFFMAYVDGSFSGGETKPMFYNYGFWAVLSYPMALAYDFFPQFNWYGVVGQGFMVGCTTLFLWLLWATWRSTLGIRWLVGGALLFLMPFWCYQIVFFRTTELAAVAAGISLLGLVGTYLPNVNQFVGSLRAVRVFAVTLLCLSVFIRLEPALMCAIAFLPLVLWITGKPKWGLLMIACLAIGSFIGSYALYMSATGDAEKEFLAIRPYRYTLWDFSQNEALYTPATAVDSVKLYAAKAYFISDEAELNAAFYERIGVLPLEKSLSSLSGYFIDFDMRIARAADAWLFLWQLQPVLFIAPWLAFMLAAMLLAYNRQYKSLWLLLGLHFWVWAILWGVTVFMKMELRVFAPHIMINLVTLVLLPILVLPKNWPVRKPKSVIIGVAIVCLLVPAYITTNELRNKAKSFQMSSQNIKVFKAEVAKLSNEGKIIVFHSFAWQLLYANLLDYNEFAQNTNFISFDNGELNMYPQFKQAMQACCGGYTVADLATYLVANKDRVIFVSDLERMDLMKRYIETVYSIPFGFEPMPLSSPTILHQPLGGAMMPEHAAHLAFSYYQLR